LNLIRVMPAKGAIVMSHQSDVAVIGGGVIGLAIAWRLSQHDISVTVVDPAPGAAASHAAAGMLAPVSEVRYGEESVLALGVESVRRYPSFVAELEAATGMTVGLRREGTLIVATDAGDRDMLAQLHQFQTSLGLSAELLTSRECRSLEPSLSPDVRCGLLAGSDLSVDNRRLTAALLAALKAAGVTTINARATGVDFTRGDRPRVSCDDATELDSATVVLAAGPWSASLPGIPAPDRPPVRPVKGEILRLHTRAGIELPDRSIRGLVNGREIYLVPRADGELVVGATVEEQGFDITVRAGAVRELLRDARAVLPTIDELELTEMTAALRPGSPDNTPVVGWATTPGLLIATGHHRNGILLTPVTADLVSDLVRGVDADPDLHRQVSPGRFAAVST
jgi:glycine oxidase